MYTGIFSLLIPERTRYRDKQERDDGKKENEKKMKNMNKKDF